MSIRGITPNLQFGRALARSESVRAYGAKLVKIVEWEKSLLSELWLKRL